MPNITSYQTRDASPNGRSAGTSPDFGPLFLIDDDAAAPPDAGAVDPADAAGSLFFDACNYYCTARGVPPRLRAVPLTVCGAARGRLRPFPLSHRAAGRRCWHYDDADWATPEEREREAAKLERKWGDYLKEYLDWQAGNPGPPLIDPDPGGMAKGGHESTDYRANCLPRINEIMKRALREPDPFMCVRRIAYRVAERETGQKVTPPPRKRRAGGGPMDADKLEALALTYAFKAAAARAQESGGSQRQAVLRLADRLREAVLSPEEYPKSETPPPQGADPVEDADARVRIFVPQPPPDAGGLRTPSSRDTKPPDDDPEPDPPPGVLPPAPLRPEEETPGGGLDAFASVGAVAFDLTTKDDRTGAADYLPGLTEAQFARHAPRLIKSCRAGGLSLIARPRGEGLYQADDIDGETLEKARPFAFLAVETSPHNFQAWLKVEGADESIRRRLIRGLGADPDASGALRWPGSLNFKHDPAPAVRVVFSNPGRRVTAADLESAGLLAPDPEPVSKTVPCWNRFPGPRAGALIQKGERHARAVRFACGLRGKGWGEGPILDALRRSAHLYAEPLPDRELASIARSVARYAPGGGVSDGYEFDRR